MHLYGTTASRKHDKMRIRHLQGQMVPFKVPQPHQKSNPQEEMDLPIMQKALMIITYRSFILQTP